MTLSHSPRIITDGLVLCLDAGNSKSYDKYENLLQYSEDFTNAYWNATTSTITANQITAPDGTLTADLISDPGEVGVYRSLTGAENTAYTYSVFLKAGTATSIRLRDTDGGLNPGHHVVFNLSTLQFSDFSNISAGNYGYISYPNGWYRIWMTFTTGNYTNLVFNPRTAESGTKTFYAWGAQLEKGSTVTDYYPTTSTAKTRGTTWTDLSGRGNNGTLTNGPTYSSANGGALVFDGVDDYVKVTLPSTTSYNTFTYNAWIYSTDNSDYRTIIDQDNDDWLFATYEGELVCYDPNIDSGYFINLNEWYNVTMTHTNGGPVLFYVNGSLVYTSSNDSTNHTTSYFGIGAGITGPTTADEFWSGNIAQVSIYNKALTASEIQQNFNALRGRFGI